MKTILKEGCSIKPGEFKNDNTMTAKIDNLLKKKIIKYLNAPKAGMIGDMEMIDPVTKEVYSHENIIRQADGFQWSSGVVYVFEKYDIMLTDEFMDFIVNRVDDT